MIDAAPQQGSLEDVIRIMATPPWWAPDLPLNADIKVKVGDKVRAVESVIAELRD